MSPLITNRGGRIFPITGPVEDTKALETGFGERISNLADNPIGIADEWSIQINVKPGQIVNNLTLLWISPNPDNRSAINIILNGATSNDPIFIRIRQTNGNQLKAYEWDNTYSVDVRVSYLFTWDGTDLSLFVDGVSAGDPDTITQDFTASMSDENRTVTIGAQRTGFAAFEGDEHSVSIWDVVLSDDAILQLDNNTRPDLFDNRFNFQHYESAGNLVHYWRNGFEGEANLGKDFGNASKLINLDTNLVNIDASDIVDYDPTVIDIKAIDFNGSDEQLLSTTEVSIGVANAWSIQVLIEPNDNSAAQMICQIKPLSGNFNRTNVILRPDLASGRLRVNFNNSAAGAIKTYDYNSVFSVGVKVNFLATWDGTTLILYVDGVVKTADSTPQDNSGTQTDGNRRIGVAAGVAANNFFIGTIHSVSIWSVTLDQDAATELDNSGSPEDLDHTVNGRDYVDALNLAHYYRVGSDPDDFGKDFGTATAIDIGDSATNISAADIVDY